MIPHTSASPPPVGDERVWIDQLDDLAQLVFKGTKTLNRIQTVVFDAAYYTNENLLISAPTGAGKTNIAMLTVLNEIKKNINESGVIQKDKFKVCVERRVRKGVCVRGVSGTVTICICGGYSLP